MPATTCARCGHDVVSHPGGQACVLEGCGCSNFQPDWSDHTSRGDGESTCVCGHAASQHGSYEGRGPAVCLVQGCGCRRFAKQEE